MTDPTESGATERPWLCGESPEKWFQTLKPPLCCQSCEQKALAHARELYEEKCNAYDDHVRIITEQREVIKGLVEAGDRLYDFIVGEECEEGRLEKWKAIKALVPEEFKK